MFGLVTSGLIPAARLWAGDKNSSICESAGKELEVPVETDFQWRVPGLIWNRESSSWIHRERSSSRQFSIVSLMPVL